MRHFIFVIASCLLLTVMSGTAQAEDSANAQRVRDFVAAFNAHDTSEMAEFVTEDVQWFAVNGASLSVETDGKSALLAAMDGYFQSCASCSSQLVEVMQSGNQVITIEEASWRGQSGMQSRRSTAVYEFAGDLIQRVYYFPAQR
ncbi:hypothetical protein CWE12_00750 [Aliidiomarina sedimenti]|uniref:SnoaL-like domain-containing protein n=1 Tax=Aliidiomarina sedimenti TaxID=1933879 RepID=A0ABY0C1A3_9GAMM|nr:nuclear transport factor 2 family protein [Aliidiomarina sedimenti]RUO31561.1 hypothetical protein CWE12_00750 [Aliidiomarina sedimenti]